MLYKINIPKNKEILRFKKINSKNSKTLQIKVKDGQSQKLKK